MLFKISCFASPLLWKSTLNYCQYRKISKFAKFRFWYQQLWGPSVGKAPIPPYKHVCQVGDPVLRERAEKVEVDEIKSDHIKKVIANMKSVFEHYDVVGVAAPQIGVPLRIIIVEFSERSFKLYSPEVRASREMEICKQTVIINPTLNIINPHKLIFDEGCCSVKGFSAEVPRYRELIVTGFNENAEPFSWQVKGWLARILQHECDHLEGRLLIDVMDVRTFQNDYWYVVNTTEGKFKHSYK